MANSLNIRDGMDVFDTTGKRIGTVNHVYADMPDAASATKMAPSTGEFDATRSRGPIEESAMGTDMGSTADTGATLPSQEGTEYLQVHHGGLLGVGGQDLYIPFAAVDTVIPDTSVTVCCTEDECLNQYTNRPQFVDQMS